MPWSAIDNLTGPPGPAGSDANVGEHESAPDPHPQYLTQDEGAPAIHAEQHGAGGSDPLSPASIGAAPTSHTHAAAAITSGTLALARLPTGTSGSTVALGDHDHPEIGAADGGYRTGLVPADSATPVVQHGLGTDKLIAAVREASTGLYVPVAIETVDAAGAPSTDWVRFSFDTQPAVGQYEYIILSAAPASTATGEHTHAQAEVSGLVDAINAKADTGHTHPQDDVDALADALAGKADLTHNHAAAAITSGTLALARIPTGTTSSTVALGNHGHGAPAAHAESHGSGGSDPVTPGAIGAATAGHSHTPAAVPTAPRAASASGSYSADGTVAGDIQLTATGNTVITPTGSPNGRTMAVEVLASGATRTPSVAGSVALTSGITSRSLEIPAGQIGVFILRYSTLPSVSTWYLASAFVVG